MAAKEVDVAVADLVSFALIPNGNYAYSRTTPLVSCLYRICLASSSSSNLNFFFSFHVLALGVSLKVTSLLRYQWWGKVVQGWSRYGFLLGLAEQLSLVGGLCITANSAVSYYDSISVSGPQRRFDSLCLAIIFRGDFLGGDTYGEQAYID